MTDPPPTKPHAPLSGTPPTPPAAPPIAPAPPPQPGWHGEPARARKTRQAPNPSDLVLGLALLAVGIWFFADVTLRLDLPAVTWGDIWPLVLMVIGGLIVLRGIGRRA